MQNTPLIIIIVLIIIAGALWWQVGPKPENSGPPVVCAMDAKLCPDGSYVARSGPTCEFAACPGAGLSCLKDSDCPSAKYLCQETQGSGTACPSSDPTCVPIHTVIAGECKLKESSVCRSDAECAAGALCHNNICIAPVGRQCTGPSDQSCPTDFACVQGCGPPVAREGDPPPPYFCELKGYMRPCPICLAKDTSIDTPAGATRVQELKVGDAVWTVNKSGERIVSVVAEVSKTPVPPTHIMIKLVLDDGRALVASPGHPTVDGRTVGELTVGDVYSGARVLSAARTPYSAGYTYDLLPSGETGFYFANGILLDSTLQ